jgi:hypothetical protein
MDKEPDTSEREKRNDVDHYSLSNQHMIFANRNISEMYCFYILSFVVNSDLVGWSLNSAKFMNNKDEYVSHVIQVVFSLNFGLHRVSEKIN